jgi:hypothetical protein
MERETLRQWLKREPFQPFRVHLVNGKTYDIHYPRMNLLAHTFIKIGIPADDLPKPFVCDYTEYVRLDQITHLELLPNSSPSENVSKD